MSATYSVQRTQEGLLTCARASPNLTRAVNRRCLAAAPCLALVQRASPLRALMPPRGGVPAVTKAVFSPPLGPGSEPPDVLFPPGGQGPRGGGSPAFHRQSLVQSLLPAMSSSLKTPPVANQRSPATSAVHPTLRSPPMLWCP